jgi:hypothetical protein
LFTLLQYFDALRAIAFFEVQSNKKMILYKIDYVKNLVTYEVKN